jgi:hypothetical protein
MNRRACPGCAERYPFATRRLHNVAVAFHCLPSGDTLRCEALPTVVAVHGEWVKLKQLSGGTTPAAKPAPVVAAPVEQSSAAA